MKLEVTAAPTQSSSSPNEVAAIATIGWTSSSELYACAEDKGIYKWDGEGNASGKVKDLKEHVITMHWYPLVGKRGMQGTGAEVFAAGCADGSFKIVGKKGRVETSVEAHTGAITALKWNYEGTALATVGEDGWVKIWSKSGMPRSSLCQMDGGLYAVAWGADSDQVMFTLGKAVVIKPLTPGMKQQTFRAHDGIILAADWNPINNLIVTGAEDCKYKVWDNFGRLLFQSAPAEHVITSVAWCPDGELFAVGSFNTLRLCDRAGWSHSRHRTQSGTLYSLSWTSDGTQVAGAGGNHNVVIGQVLNRTLEWKNFVVTLEGSTRITIVDVLSENIEELDFRDRVVNMSIGSGYLIVATLTQCYIYNTHNFHTPHIFDVKDTVSLIAQTQSHFLTVDPGTGIQIITYEGRQVSNPRFQGLRSEYLNEQSVSLSPDTLAVIDRSNSKTIIRFFNTLTGKAIGEGVAHNLEIIDIRLSQLGNESSRKVVFIDRNRDLYMTTVTQLRVTKLATMVDAALWHDEADMLATISDGKLAVWYYPNVVYVDPDLIPITKVVKDGEGAYGMNMCTKIMNFEGARVTVRRGDGALTTASISPYPLLLHARLQAREWDQATRLCRFAKEPSLWACLAAMAVEEQELDTAEAAFAALEEIDKLQYILHIKGEPTEEGRNAELALFMRRPAEAEDILLQAGLIYKAIKLNVRLFQWDRALELAMTHKVHMDTVLYYRQKFMANCRRPESHPRFLQLSQEVEVDKEVVKNKIREEKEQEMTRPGKRRASISYN